jgi:hypothetical protein
MVAVESPEANLGKHGHSVIEVWDVEESRLVEQFVTTLDALDEDLGAAGKQRNGQLVPLRNSAAQAIAELLASQGKSEGLDVDGDDSRSAMLESPFRHPEADVPLGAHSISTFFCSSDIFGTSYGGNGNERLEVSLEGSVDDFSLPSAARERSVMLIGSQDCRVRLWDLDSVHRSKIICGADVDDDKPVFE